MIDIINESETRTDKTIVDHTNTICISCGSTETSRWLKYKGNDNKERWDGTSYLCNKCYQFIKKHGPLSRYDVEKIRSEYFSNKIHGRKCCECGNSHTSIDSKGSPKWIKDRLVNGSWTGKWLCFNCYGKDYQANDPDSQHNIRKLIANSRTGNLNVDSTVGTGLIGEAVIAKVRHLEIISIKENNFRSKFDLSRDIEYGIIQSKFKSYDWPGRKIHFSEHNFDTLFILCREKNGIYIERVYAIPIEELYDIKSLTIQDSGNSKWEKFGVDKKPYRDCHQDLLSYLNHKKYFGIEDIEKWLRM